MDTKGSKGGTAAGAARQRGRGSGLEGERFSLLSNFPYAHPGPEKESRRPRNGKGKARSRGHGRSRLGSSGGGSSSDRVADAGGGNADCGGGGDSSSGTGDPGRRKGALSAVEMVENYFRDQEMAHELAAHDNSPDCSEGGSSCGRVSGSRRGGDGSSSSKRGSSSSGRSKSSSKRSSKRSGKRNSKRSSKRSNSNSSSSSNSGNSSSGGSSRGSTGGRGGAGDSGGDDGDDNGGGSGGESAASDDLPPLPVPDASLGAEARAERQRQNEPAMPATTPLADIQPPPTAGSIDWKCVDSVNIVEAMLAPATTYVDVPGGRDGRDRHLRVQGQVLAELREAIMQCGARVEGKRAVSMRVTRALKWRLLLPQLLLRTPVRAGKKQRPSRTLVVAHRLSMWEQGGQRQLLERLAKDQARASGARQRRKQRGQSGQPVAMGDSDDVKQLLDLLAAGSFRKAIRLLNSLGVMATTELDVQHQLRAKHPQRGDLGGEPTSMPTPGEYDLPCSYGEDHTDFIHLTAEDVGTACFGLAREKAMSPNGARNEHLTPFGFAHAAGSREAAALADFAFFGECYVNVHLPAWYYCLSASARLVALLKEKIKAGGDAKVRPLAVGDVERRLFCSMLVRMTGPDFAEWLGPYQVAVGVKASAEKLAFGLRAAMERLPTFALWKLDLSTTITLYSAV